MIEIDGADGGGQVLRSALTLSVIQQEAVTIEHIRGGRDTPGLRPQHLAGVQALATLTEAEVQGASVGSERVVFDPQRPPSGTVDIDIGTAGAISLLFETVLPLGPVLDDPITVTATGGTDVRWSPTMDYLQFVKRPVLEDHGLSVDLEVHRRGYYPKGGGSASVTVHPGELSHFDLEGETSLSAVSIHSHASDDLADAAVVSRQIEGAIDRLEEADIPVNSTTSAYHDTESTGTSVTVVGHLEDGYGGGDTLGEPGKPAEVVGASAVDDLLEGWTPDAAVDRYLADQLMVPLAIGGGRIAIPDMSDHVRTNLAVIKAFDLPISLQGDNAETTVATSSR